MYDSAKSSSTLRLGETDRLLNEGEFLDPKIVDDDGDNDLSSANLHPPPPPTGFHSARGGDEGRDDERSTTALSAPMSVTR